MGERHRVFCASMADVFDNRAPEGVRERLWVLIDKTPWLHWLLLTKRPQNIKKMLPHFWYDGWPNVWLGTTAEHQTEFDKRAVALFDVPARVHFFSCEPLLGDIQLERYIHTACLHTTPGHSCTDDYEYCMILKIDWVIVGGESGPKSRPMHPDWARKLRDQCATTGTALHFKQWGEWAPDANFPDHIPRARLYRFDDDTLSDDEAVWRVGKKAASRLLDGREWNEVPEASRP